MSQRGKIHSSGSASQRSLLSSVVENCFPGSNFAAWSNLSQVQPVRKSRPLPINKQAKTIQRTAMICYLASRKNPKEDLDFSEVEESGAKIHSLKWDFWKELYEIAQSKELISLRNKQKYPRKSSGNSTFIKLNVALSLYSTGGPEQRFKSCAT